MTKAIEIFQHNQFYMKNFLWLITLGFAYRKLKKYIEAIKDFEQAPYYTWNSCETWYNLGVCYQVIYFCEFAEKAFYMAEHSHIQILNYINRKCKKKCRFYLL